MYGARARGDPAFFPAPGAAPLPVQQIFQDLFLHSTSLSSDAVDRSRCACQKMYATICPGLLLPQLAKGAGRQLRRAGGAAHQVLQQLPAGAVILGQQLHRCLQVRLILAVMTAEEECAEGGQAWRAWRAGSTAVRALFSRHTSDCSHWQPQCAAHFVQPNPATHLKSSTPHTNTSPTSLCRRRERWQAMPQKVSQTRVAGQRGAESRWRQPQAGGSCQACRTWIDSALVSCEGPLRARADKMHSSSTTASARKSSLCSSGSRRIGSSGSGVIQEWTPSSQKKTVPRQRQHNDPQCPTTPPSASRRTTAPGPAPAACRLLSRRRALGRAPERRLPPWRAACLPAPR